MIDLRMAAALIFVALASAGCSQRFLQLPVPYKTQAVAGPDTFSCATTGLTGLGFVFVRESTADDAQARRVTARGSGRNHLEYARLKLLEKDGEQLLEVSLGISTRRTALDPDSPLAFGSLASPSRQSISEIDALIARCQRSPIGKDR